MSTSTLDIASVRAAFPALSGNTPYIFADNAGGSQCLKSVADAVTDYLLNTNVQLGADYSVSKTSTQRVASASEAAKEFFNAESADEIIFGSSSTQVAENLSRALEDDFKDGDEIIITPEHEANGGPWKKLAKRKGLTLKTWRPTATDPSNPVSIALKKEDLLPLVTSRTRLIAFTACSNILGSIVPVEDVVRAARAKGGEVNVRKLEFSIDCVAYAPHRLIDVSKWDVEYCFFSMYKVYGTHSAILYAKASALASSVSPLSHHFLSVSAPGSAKGYKLAAPSGPCYELAYSCRPVLDYLKSLTPSGTLSDAEKAIAKQEHALLDVILGFLTAPEQESRGVQIVGSSINNDSRVPTVSFIVRGDQPLKSKDVVAHLDKATGVGIRYGHFYAYTLVKELHGMEDVEDGVVRVSLVHYNTVEEAQRIVELLKEALA